jgi:protein TonB
MDLQDNLIESNSTGRKGGWKAYAGSLLMHGIIIGFVLFMSAATAHVVDAHQQPIRAYLSQGAAPPPPPPPPPPPASGAKSAGSPKPKQVAEIQLPKPVTPLTPPVEIPKEIPIPQPVQLKIEEAQPLPQPMISSSPGGDGSDQSTSTAGVPGGVAGGVAGGTVGGVVGGEIGGVKGGVVGGQVGGQLGGTGTGTAGNGTGDQTAPLRVGGDVSAPTIISKFEPKYTEPARHAHLTGVVVVEAIISKQGTVEEVKVLKGLPMGLSEEAMEAVRKWRFKPGRLNGEPVDVIFNLTVNFRMD